jgi:hypothetical protein
VSTTRNDLEYLRFIIPAKRLCHNKVNVILRSRSDEESLFLIQSIHFCITLRSFIPHGGIQDDSFLIATQSRKLESGLSEPNDATNTEKDSSDTSKNDMV